MTDKPEAPAKPEDIRQFDVYVDGNYYLVEVSEKGGAPRVVSSRPASQPISHTPAPKPATPAPNQAAPVAPPAPTVAVEGGTPIVSPMPGMFVKYEKQIGDKVKHGESVLVLEAMKMYNNIPSPVDGTLVAAPFASGANVGKGDVLAVIKPD